MPENKASPSSFRDPSGFVFEQNGELFRQINFIYRENYDFLMQSRLYKFLSEKGWLVTHSEKEDGLPDGAYKIIEPERVPFISYPYEWCFSQLKDAALLTLRIQKAALDFGMSLRDASAYNVQFHKGKPIFIDTLSFEKYRDGEPWVAYRQFCEHFLAPLALMSKKDVRLSGLLKANPDGLPLDLAAGLLPSVSLLKPSLFLHLYLHSKSQKFFADKNSKLPKARNFSKSKLYVLTNNLTEAVQGLKWRPKGTEWAEYYDITNYSDDGMLHKKELVSVFLDQLRPKKVLDLGANDGVFSRIAARKNIFTVALDIDSAAVEKNYLAVKQNKEINLLPLLADIANPSPGLGWENKERESFLERGSWDVILALALVHHLAISRNLPLRNIAALFSRLAPALIIEFISKDDSQIQKLLKNREDVFLDYNRESFEKEFGKYFIIKEAVPIRESARTLYLMIRKSR